MAHEIVLILEHPSGVQYENTIEPIPNAKKIFEGVLVPIHLDPEFSKHIRNLAYPPGAGGLTTALANAVDRILASTPATTFLNVDHEHLSRSQEAWIHVVVDSPQTTVIELCPGYLGPVYGFGKTSGVLTWRK